MAKGIGGGVAFALGGDGSARFAAVEAGGGDLGGRARVGLDERHGDARAPLLVGLFAYLRFEASRRRGGASEGPAVSG